MSAIEPFETSLRENTPLASINDPGALVEYLNQLNLKSDMVLNEFKRVSSERDSFKERLEVAERDTKEARDCIADLQERQVTSNETENHSSDDKSSEKTGNLQSSSNLIRSPTIKTQQISLESPLAPAESRASNTSNVLLLSHTPTHTPAQPPKLDAEAEEFFSYDSELPRLENELKVKQDEVRELQGQVSHLKDDLAVARESTQIMVKTLERSTREVNSLRDEKEGYEANLREHSSASDATIKTLKRDLEAVQGKLREFDVMHVKESNDKVFGLEQRLSDANTELEKVQQLSIEKPEANATIERLQNDVNLLNAELSTIQNQKDESQKRINTLNEAVSSLKERLSSTEQDGLRLKSELVDSFQIANHLRERLTQAQQEGIVRENVAIQAESANLNDKVAPKEITTTKHVDSKATSDATVITKKKNKKKKKGGKIAVEPENSAQNDPPELSKATVDSSTTRAEQSDTIFRLQTELDNLRNLLLEKDAAIERLDKKLKNEDDLKEEIESLREELLEIGQEHVTAKDRIKGLIAEKNALQLSATSLEGEIAELRASRLSRTADADRAQKDLTVQFEDLKIKATNLQIDLSAAQQLASSRFKEITDMRAVLQKAQPELISLRKEVTDLKGAKDVLDIRVVNLQRVEARQDTLRTELESMKKAVAEKDSEVKVLNLRLDQETSNRLSAEQASNSMGLQLQQLETEKRQASQSLERLSRDLSKSRDELNLSRIRVVELDDSLAKLNQDGESLREEIELKTAQYASAESLMSSMRDQSTEMAMQAKEARERCDNLEEEVADAHRLLSERGREAETMRRLLAEVESRTDSRLREMKDRMDMAVEERDRAEDEVSTIGRRRTRELEEIRTRLKDAERNLKRSEDDKEILELAQRDWRRRREELEQMTERSSREAEEVKKAMSELRDTLDESERQASDLEKQKVELRRTVEETQHRLDKIQKSNKVCYRLFGLLSHNTIDIQSQAMADEVRLIQSTKAKVISEAQSSRSSLESTPSRATMSPTVNKEFQHGQGLGTMDYVYLKNVLLQFLEQRDKKHQMQLIPVLGMLLHFDRYR